MTTFQLLGCKINLGGNRDSVIVRSRYAEPVTYPELMILRAIHGGDEHVYDVMSVGTVNRSMSEEYERLAMKYGDLPVFEMFGAPGSRDMQASDDNLPSEEEILAGDTAAKAARAKARAKRPPRSIELPPGADAVSEGP